MPLKVIKTLNENSTKCYGQNRIIIGSFQHGLIELARVIFVEIFKTCNSNGFFTTLSRYNPLIFILGTTHN